MKIKEKFKMPDGMYTKNVMGKVAFFMDVTNHDGKKTIDLGRNYAVAVARFDKIFWQEFTNKTDFTAVCIRYFDEVVNKARKLAGIKSNEFQFRDLRAKKGTDVFNKFGLEEAKSILGHASERMTRVYIRNEMGDIVQMKK